MKIYPNFYETLKETEMRLNNTIVMYDGAPYYVLCVSDHKNDGVYRVYLDPLGNPNGMEINELPFGESVPYDWYDEPGIGNSKGEKMDAYLDKYDGKTRIVRKMANSPLFNKFRPFPLGMENTGGDVYYIERQPVRHTQQGLTQQMIRTTCLIPSSSMKSSGGGLLGSNISIFHQDFYAMLMGDYPTAQEIVEQLRDPNILNNAVAFHREFAIVRGPLDMMYLAYRTDIIGVMPKGSLDKVCLGRNFVYTKEVVRDLGIFNSIELMD